ncbi:MAG: c-type cytochrome, partial [Planctomycetia bacterium]
MTRAVFGGMRWSVVAAAAVAACGCGLQMPAEYPASQYTRLQLLGAAAGEGAEKPAAVPDEVREKIRVTLNTMFGTPIDPGMPADSMTAVEKNNVRLGAHLYHRHCIHCHGLAGDGEGPTAPFLNPRPRDFRRGVFKWKSTVRNAKPTRDDLVRLLKEGAAGTSMPPFVLLPEADLDRLVDYVVFLSKRGELERKLLQNQLLEETLPDEDLLVEMVEELNDGWKTAGKRLVTPGPTPAVDFESSEFQASVERGRKLYLSDKAACYKCHAADGRADPAKIAESERKLMVDDWGRPNYARNLHQGLFRGGRRPVDIYRRVHQGIAGA